MGFFGKAKKRSGWLSFHLTESGIYMAHVSRPPDDKPIVERATFYASNKSSWPATLEKVAKEEHADRYQCTTLLASGEYQLLSVDAPNVPPDELKTAIRWRLKDMLDFHIDDATIDVLDVPLEKNASTRNHSMFAIAARNQLIGERQALFQDAKIPISVIDLPEMAQRNISALMAEEGRGLALLSFDANGGLLTVTFAGELYLARRIDIALQQLVESVGEQRTAYYDRIALELQRSLDHFDRQYHFITVPKLVLSPLGEAEAGLRDYLAANLYIPIEVLNLDSVLNTSQAAVLQDSASQQAYFLAVGAALRHEESVL